MKAYDIVYPGGSVFELEKGDGIRKPGKEDAVKLCLAVSRQLSAPKRSHKTRVYLHSKKRT
jgi:hypothetical protein